MDEKICNKCLNKYPASLKYFYSNGMGGLRGDCKECHNKSVKRHYQKNKKIIKKQKQLYYKNNKEEINIKHKQYYRNNKEERKKQFQKDHLLRTYGISKETFDEIFIYIQKKRCMICGKLIEKYQVDHNHKTGEFRGLLCINCNTGIGSLKENPFIFIRTIKYLKGERYRKI